MLVAGVLVVSLQASSAHAILAGVKSLGMAAAVSAYPVDTLSGAYNPAGIALLGDRWDAGLSWANTHGAATIKNLPHYSAPPALGGILAGALAASHAPQPDTLNGTRYGTKTSSMYVPEFGAVKHFCPNFCGTGKFDFAVGLISYNRNYIKTTYGKPFELFGTTKTGLELVQQTLGCLLTATYCKMHTFGIAINYNIQRLKVNGLQTFATPFFSVAPKRATDKGYSYSNGVGVILGYMFEYKGLKLGGAWQPETTMRKFARYAGFVADRGSFNLPMRYDLGISYKFACRLGLAFAYEYIRWTGIPHLRNATFPNLQLGATDPEYLLGAKHGAGFGFRNQHFYRFGADYEINDCFTVRAGFRHANTPIKDEFTAINLLNLDCMQDVLTLGGTWRVNPCNELSFFWACGFTHHVHGKNSVPAWVPTTNPVTGARTNYPANVDVNQPIPQGLNPAPGVAKAAKGEIDLRQRICVLGFAWGRTF